MQELGRGKTLEGVDGIFEGVRLRSLSHLFSVLSSQLHMDALSYDLNT